jgi:MarR family transcriptional regulator, lower aerobic nicotinate degradation pathway regulator
MAPRRSQSTAAARRREIGAVDGLAQLSFIVSGLLERRSAEHDLSMIQIRLLGVLRDRTPTINQLAALLSLDKSSVSGLVDRAQRRGLVARVPAKADRRSVLVSLTDSGRTLASRVAVAFDDDVSRMLDRLSPTNRDTLATLISRLLDAHASAHGIDLFDTTAG